MKTSKAVNIQIVGFGFGIFGLEEEVKKKTEDALSLENRSLDTGLQDSRLCLKRLSTFGSFQMQATLNHCRESVEVSYTLQLFETGERSKESNYTRMGLHTYFIHITA